MNPDKRAVKAVVLAGGKGRRLAPYTLIIPKPLMPIKDVPILEILLRQMKHAGIEEVMLTVGYLADLLLVDGDPLEDVAILQQRDRLKAIMKDGVFWKSPGLDILGLAG